MYVHTCVCMYRNGKSFRWLFGSKVSREHKDVPVCSSADQKLIVVRQCKVGHCSKVVVVNVECPVSLKGIQ